MSLKDVLADKNVPDTQEIEIAGVKIKVGELREQTSALSAREQALNERTALVQRQQEEAARLYASVQNTPRTTTDNTLTPSAANSKDYDYSADPYLAPIWKRIEQVENTKLTAAEKEIQTLKAQQQQMTAHYMLSKWEDQFEALSDKPKDLSLDTLLKKTTDEKILDKTGMPDIRKAYKQFYDDPRKAEADRVAAEKRGYDKAMAEAKTSMIPRASLNRTPLAPSLTNEPATKVYQDLNAAIDAAKADPEINAQWLGLDLSSVS